MEKTCAKCGETKDATMFGRNKARRDGLQTYCKPCQVSSVVTSQHRNGDSLKRARSTERGYHLRSRYGITEGEYTTMLEGQGGGCKICGSACETGRRLAVDHCHKSGKVRGLLCASCNIGLGKFKDSPELLASALKYLQEN